MKKFLFTALTAALVFATSIGTSAQEVYWEGMLDSAQITHEVNKGNLNISIIPLEYTNNQRYIDGLDVELKLDLGVYDNTEIHGYLYTNDIFQNVIVNLKHNFYNENDLLLSGVGEIYFINYVDQAHIFPGIKLLTEKKLNEQLTLNNNFDIVAGQGKLGKGMQNGLSYQFNDQHALKLNLQTVFVGGNISQFKGEAAYQNIISDEMTYNLYLGKEFSTPNILISNTLQYQPTEDLKLVGNYRINTNTSNFLTLRGEKELDERLTFFGEYEHQLNQGGYRAIKTGLNYKI